MEKIAKKRHIAKTITWRIVATTDTFLISLVVTGRFDWAAGIASFEVFTKTVLYYLHERFWYQHIRFGVKSV